MQIFITDNRYAPGSSHSDLPYDALAAYSARWLDRGSGVPADVLPDRQGIAWDHDQYKVILLGEQVVIEPRAIGLEVAAQVYGQVCAETIRRLQDEEGFPCVRYGTRRLVPVAAADAWLAARAERDTGRVESPSSKAGPVPSVGPADEDDSLFARAFRAEMARS